MSEDNIFVWNATIFGPADTPWEVSSSPADMARGVDFADH
jgi:hypothetical protein